MAFSTYIVTNRRNGTLYVGHTDAVYERVEQHRNGQYPGFSSRYGLNHLVWFEDFDTREEALHRERRIKKWNRA